MRAPGIMQKVRHLLTRERGINRHDQRADKQASEIRDRPFRTVFTQDGNAIALGDAPFAVAREPHPRRSDRTPTKEMEIHWMSRRCMTTTRSLRSTTAKKISLTVRRLMRCRSAREWNKHTLAAVRNSAHSKGRKKSYEVDFARAARFDLRKQCTSLTTAKQRPRHSPVNTARTETANTATTKENVMPTNRKLTLPSEVVMINTRGGAVW